MARQPLIAEECRPPDRIGPPSPEYEYGPVEQPPKRRYFYNKATFAQFLHGQSRMTEAEWIWEPGLRIYVRRALRELRGPRVHIDLANIHAKPQGKGALTRFLDRWEPCLGFCIEVVSAPRFIAFWERRGYEVTQRPGYRSIDMIRRLPPDVDVYPKLYMPRGRE